VKLTVVPDYHQLAAHYASLAVVGVLSLATGGCMRDTRLDDADIRLNHDPKHLYVLTIAIHDAPGSFDHAEAWASYEVQNPGCVPLTPFEGATITPTKTIPLELSRRADSSYIATMVLDQLVDQDYFGQGMCHWAFTGAGATFTSGVVSFNTYLGADDVTGERRSERFYSNRSYAMKDTEHSDSGNLHRNDFKEEAKQTFSITLGAKEKNK
jgi:hypothetical protein